MNSPTVRVVERAGTKIVEDLGNTNPWRMEWSCPRKSCLPCQGQAILAAEKEQEALAMVTGETELEKDKIKWPRKDCRSLPGCTGEGINYTLECLPCRKNGVKRWYYGESSRSPYQRGKEHLREIHEEVAAHPLVTHFREEHGGKTQEILMRVVSWIGRCVNPSI